MSDTRAPSQNVTAEHLRWLATVDRQSLFRDANTLVLSDEGVTVVPWHVVEATLSGKTRFVHRVLFSRDGFADCGVQVGRKPRTTDGTDLDAKLAMLAAGLNF